VLEILTLGVVEMEWLEILTLGVEEWMVVVVGLLIEVVVEMVLEPYDLLEVDPDLPSSVFNSSISHAL